MSSSGDWSEMANLVAVGSEGLGRLSLGAGSLLCLGQLSGGGLLALVVGKSLSLSSVLQAIEMVSNKSLSTPSFHNPGLHKHTGQQRPGTSSRSRG